MRMVAAFVALMLSVATAFAQGYPNKPCAWWWALRQAARAT